MTQSQRLSTLRKFAGLSGGHIRATNRTPGTQSSGCTTAGHHALGPNIYRGPSTPTPARVGRAATSRYRDFGTPDLTTTFWFRQLHRTPSLETDLPVGRNAERNQPRALALDSFGGRLIQATDSG